VSRRKRARIRDGQGHYIIDACPPLGGYRVQVLNIEGDTDIKSVLRRRGSTDIRSVLSTRPEGLREQRPRCFAYIIMTRDLR
jgi:hypothetical protein